MSTKHSCDVLIVTCIDFRFQKHIENWLSQHVGAGNYDRVAWAGGVFDSTGVMRQVDISVRLHNIKKLILMNHEDCGVYGEAGTFERHAKDLREFKQKILKQYPKLKDELYYVHLEGEFERIK